MDIPESDKVKIDTLVKLPDGKRSASFMVKNNFFAISLPDPCFQKCYRH